MKNESEKLETDEASSKAILCAWIVLVAASLLLCAAISSGEISFGSKLRGPYIEFKRAAEPEKFWGVVSLYVMLIFVGSCVLLVLRAKDPPPKPTETTQRDWMGHPIDKPDK